MQIYDAIQYKAFNNSFQPTNTSYPCQSTKVFAIRFITLTSIRKVAWSAKKKKEKS